MKACYLEDVGFGMSSKFQPKVQKQRGGFPTRSSGKVRTHLPVQKQKLPNVESPIPSLRVEDPSALVPSSPLKRVPNPISESSASQLELASAEKGSDLSSPMQAEIIQDSFAIKPGVEESKILPEKEDKAKVLERELAQALEYYSARRQRMPFSTPEQLNNTISRGSRSQKGQALKELELQKMIEGKVLLINTMFMRELQGQSVAWVTKEEGETVTVLMQNNTLRELNQTEKHCLSWMVNLFREDIKLGCRIRPEENAHNPLDPEMQENNEEHVAEILDGHYPNEIPGVPECYLVRFWGLDLDQAQWIPGEDMFCADMIADF